jgi:hypothetical protein
MDTAKILTVLRAELNRIEQAISALESLDVIGRPNVTAPSTQPATAKTRGRRTMSAAARKKIAEAQRKRWAAQKKASQPQSGVKKAAPARHMSAATRRRLSILAKKRWAARKKAAKP